MACKSYFFVNDKSLLPVWSVKSGKYSLNGIGCKTSVKFVIDHWLVLIHLLLVRSVCYKSICQFRFHLG